MQPIASPTVNDTPIAADDRISIFPGESINLTTYLLSIANKNRCF